MKNRIITYFKLFLEAAINGPIMTFLCVLSGVITVYLYHTMNTGSLAHYERPQNGFFTPIASSLVSMLLASSLVFFAPAFVSFTDAFKPIAFAILGGAVISMVMNIAETLLFQSMLQTLTVLAIVPFGTILGTFLGVKAVKFHEIEIAKKQVPEKRVPGIF